MLGSHALLQRSNPFVQHALVSLQHTCNETVCCLSPLFLGRSQLGAKRVRSLDGTPPAQRALDHPLNVVVSRLGTVLRVLKHPDKLDQRDDVGLWREVHVLGKDGHLRAATDGPSERSQALNVGRVVRLVL